MSVEPAPPFSVLTDTTVLMILYQQNVDNIPFPNTDKTEAAVVEQAAVPTHQYQYHSNYLLLAGRREESTSTRSHLSLQSQSSRRNGRATRALK